MIVFIEGRNLNDLRKRLRERRIAAIYEYNPQTHGELPTIATVVTSIHLEMRGDPETLYTTEWLRHDPSSEKHGGFAASI